MLEICFERLISSHDSGLAVVPAKSPTAVCQWHLRVLLLPANKNKRDMGRNGISSILVCLPSFPIILFVLVFLLVLLLLFFLALVPLSLREFYSWPWRSFHFQTLQTERTCKHNVSKVMSSIWIGGIRMSCWGT
jgi:hypothetical protein